MYMTTLEVHHETCAYDVGQDPKLVNLRATYTTSDHLYLSFGCSSTGSISNYYRSKHCMLAEELHDAL